MIYVLTKAYNAYDQHGEYFIHAWTHEPSKEELLEFYCDHLGREGDEYSWFSLEAIKEGK